MLAARSSKVFKIVCRFGSISLVPLLAMISSAATPLSASRTSAHATFPVRYTITDLGELPGSDGSNALSVNDRGDIVGYCGSIFSDEPPHSLRPFLYSDGSMKEIGKRAQMGRYDVAFYRAVKVNAVGAVLLENDYGRAALHTAVSLWTDGRETPLIPPKGSIWSWPSGITSNDKGDIVGAVTTSHGTDIIQDSDQPKARPVLYRAGTYKMLPLLKGYPYAKPVAIDNLGHVACNADGGRPNGASRCAYIIDGRRTIAIGRSANYNSSAIGMNDHMEVVGIRENVTTNDTNAFLYDRLHGFRILPSLGGRNCYARAINNHSVIVGDSETPVAKHEDANSLADMAQAPHACVWKNGQIHDLNSLIPRGSGWLLTTASSINNHGEIVGSGEIHGKVHSFLLTPDTPHK